MNNSLGRQISLILIVLLTLTIPAYGSNSKLLKQKRKELSSIYTKINRTKQAISVVREKEKGVFRELKTTEQVLNKTNEELSDLEKKLSKANSQVSDVKAQLEEAIEKQKGQLDFFKKRVRMVYEHGSIGYLEVLLGAEDFSDFLTRFEFLSLIVKRDAKLYQQIKQQREEIEAKKKQIEAKQAEISFLNRLTKSKKRTIEKQVAEKGQLLAEIQQQKEAYIKALDDELEASRKMEVIIKRMQAKSTLRKSYVNKGNGRLIFPTSGTITSPFGWRYHPIFKVRKFHAGIDIGAPTGQPVHAAAEGEVIYADYMGGYGKAVVINHGGNIATLYGHNSAILVSVGQKIKQGQAISRVGSTGNSTGPHLHFEVQVNGKPVNPFDWL